MADYFTRYDSNAGATAIYTPIETDPIGATLAIKVPSYRTRITKIIVSVVGNAAQAVTGAIYVLKVHGKAVSSEQEIVVYASQYEEGGGTVTGTNVGSARPFILFCDIPVKAGNDLQLSWAYVGTDPGTPFINVTIEMN